MKYLYSLDIRLYRNMCRDERQHLIDQIIADTQHVIHSLKYTVNSDWLDLDLTILQLKAMFALYAVERMTMRRLAGMLGTSVTAITGIVDRLVQHGLVSREEDPADRRLVIARLTEAGRRELERLQEIKRERFSHILSRLSDEELCTVGKALEILKRSVLAEVTSSCDQLLSQRGQQ